MGMSKLLIPLFMAGAMMESTFGSSHGVRRYATNTDYHSADTVKHLKQKAEEKRIRKMNKRKGL